MAEPRYRWVIVVGAAGSLLLDGGLAAASAAHALAGFQFAFGLMMGLGTSAIFAPIMACVTGWFVAVMVPVSPS